MPVHPLIQRLRPHRRAWRPAWLAPAALAALCAAQDPAPLPPPGQAAIDAAIDRGALYLLAQQAGRVPRFDQPAEARVGQAALTLYTLLKAGIARDAPPVRELLEVVLAASPTQTYDAACALLALDEHDRIGNRRWIEELARRLIAWRSEHGDWGYGDGSDVVRDLSNTQYAALALWVAMQAGVRIDNQVWEDLSQALERYQPKHGGFEYREHGELGVATGSMTAAGVGTLAICEIGLRQGGGLTKALEARIRATRAGGLEWLAREFSPKENPGSGAWYLYYMYGLERVGATTGAVQFGERDWYAEGSAEVVARQGADGSWVRGNPSDTCFAILFLKRATGGRRVPSTGKSEPRGSFDAPVHLAAAGAGPVQLSIDRWQPHVQRSLEWPGERGRGARVQRVEYLDGERLIAVVLGDPARGAASETFGSACVFDAPGPHRLRARVFALEPDGQGKTVRMLESQVAEVAVARALPRWTAEFAVDLGPNLAKSVQVRVEASSTVAAEDAPLGKAYPPERALDGSGATPWLAAPGDETRTLSITFSRAVDCNWIRVSPAVLPALGPGALARPVEIAVEINGKARGRLAMDPDPLHPIRLRLEHRLPVQKLELKILSVAPSPESACVGIGEVELFWQN